MTMPKFTPVAWLRDKLDGGLSTMTDCCTNVVKEIWLKANPKNVERYTAPLYTADQLTEAYEAGKMEQAAQIEMTREAIEYLITWQVKNVDKWENSAYDFADRVLSKITPDQALEQFAAKVREQCAQMLLNGSFLHDQSPAKLLATEAAKAIRAIKKLP